MSAFMHDNIAIVVRWAQQQRDTLGDATGPAAVTPPPGMTLGEVFDLLATSAQQVMPIPTSSPSSPPGAGV